MKKHFKILFIVAPVILVAAALLVKVSSAATPSSAQLPISCYDSVTQSSRPVDPDRGCAISDDVIGCPDSAPTVWFGTKDFVQGDIVIKDNIQTMFCIPDYAPELTDPVKCKKPNGSIYYSDLLCGAYTGPNNTTIYPEIIQCKKDSVLQNGGCSKISSSPSPSPSPSASPAAMMACGMNGGYWRISDNSCQSSSNCWDTGHADYNILACQIMRRDAPPPSPSPTPAPAVGTCPRKPDPKKGKAEPVGISEEFEAQAVSPDYYFWGCYSTPDKSATPSCTPQKASRAGTTTSPCVYGEESIVCSKKDVSYKDGNFLKCAPIKKTEAKPVPDPIVIREIVKEVVTVESEPREAPTVLIPTVITEDNCKAYKTEVSEKVILQGNAFIKAADETLKASTIKNPEFKKIFYETLKDAAKNSRKLDSLVKNPKCTTEALGLIQSTAQNYERVNLERVKETLPFIGKDTKVVSQYIGIREDEKWLADFEKSFKGDAKKLAPHRETIEKFHKVSADFYEIVRDEKVGLVFGFEIDIIAGELATLRKGLEKKQTESAQKKTSLKKDSKSLKKASKVEKKTKHEKKAKKATKKTKKKKKSNTQ